MMVVGAAFLFVVVAIDVERTVVEAHMRRVRWRRAQLEANRIIKQWIDRGVWQPALYNR
jgi:hypothetical protein